MKIKSFRTVKRAVLPLLSMLVFALFVMGSMKRVEAETKEISIDINAEEGSSPTYGKSSNQSVTRSGSWITLYQPNNYNYRIDYSANTTGKTRIGYVYIKEGTNTVMAYTITQSPSITVTYDKNGGSGSNLTRSVIYGKTYGKVDKPTRTGYDFIGWYTAESGGSQVTETTLMKSTNNHTLYARWEPKSFTVTLKDGTTTVSTKTVSYGSTYGELADRTKSGYDFDGWFTSSSGGSKVTASTKVTITANQTLYAHWTLKNFTISFDSCGGSSVSSITVKYNGTYGTMKSPTRTGYKFDGWYTSAIGGNKVTASTKVTITSNQTLYAHWTGNMYTVTYDKNGGSGTNFTRSIAYGNTYVKVDKPTRTGYDFIGWYTAKSGGSQVTETTIMSTASNHTLYARWSPKKYTVYFNSQGGSSVTSKTVTYDSTYGSLSSPTRTGYTFDGWFTTANSGSKITASTKVTITVTQTLHAHWTANNYTVTYDKNGGSGDNFTRTIAYESTYGKVDNPTRTGYDFAGWYTEKTEGSQVVETTIMSTAANHTLYAHWTPHKYTVTYDKNGGSGDNFTRSIAYCSTYGKVDNPTRTGYNFTGWYTKKTGGNQVVETTIMSTTANHTLYAHWTAKTFTVTYNLNGGEGSNFTRSIAFGSTYGKVDSPKRAGYTFTGWYTKKTGGNQVVETTKMSTAANHTLYAQWTPKTYTVTFAIYGEGTVSSKTVTYGSTYGTLPSMPWTNRTFTGWYTEVIGGSKITDSTIVEITQDLTLYARWEYTVTFDLNGGAGENFTRLFEVGSVAGVMVDDPTRTGYTFAGWYTEKTGGSKVLEALILPTKVDQTLYAHWQPNTYTVSFAVKGDTSGVPLVITTKTVTYGNAYGPLPSIGKTYFTFTGWYTMERGGAQVTESTKVTITADQTLYAHWTGKPFTVTYDLNGGDGSNFTRTVAYEDTYGEVSSPSRTGYLFSGWYTERSGGSQVTANTVMSNPADHTLYAHWKPKTSQPFNSFCCSACGYNLMRSGYHVTGDCVHPSYDVCICARCGKATQCNVVYKSHNYVPIRAVEPTCSSCGRIDYRCTVCGLVQYSRTIEKVPHYPISTRVEPTYDSDGLETVWCRVCSLVLSTTVIPKLQHTCGVILDPQNGDVNITVSVIQGEKYGASLPTVTKTGYNFKGWYTAKTGGTKITSESIVPNSTVVQLYAQWSVKTYTVKFDANGGTGGPSSMKKSYGKAAVIPVETPDKLDYEFLGWADTLEDAAAKKISCSPGGYFTRNKSMTLYAVWGQYTNLVRTDEMGKSIYIYDRDVDQLKQEVNNWKGINDTSDTYSTDGYTLLEQIRNALYYKSSDHRLHDVCHVLKSSIEQIDRSGLKYLEIRIPKSSASITLFGVYTTDVIENQDTWGWFNLSAFSATLPSAYKTELSKYLKVTSAEAPNGTYFGKQRDYEKDYQDPGAYEGLSFRTALKEIIREGVREEILKDMDLPYSTMLEYDKELEEERTQYRAELLGGGLCGQTAAVNLYFYFAMDEKTITKEKFGTELLEYFRMENDPFDWTERELSKGEGGHGGDGWGSICDYLNIKLKPLGLSASAGFEGFQGDTDKQFELTKKMVQEGTPVLMSFYSGLEDLRMLNLDNNLFSTDVNTANNHYVLVTGIYESARGESVYLRVASWGKVYYINWNEYAAKANQGLDGNVGCGYVVIK